MLASPLPLGPFLVEDGGRLTFRDNTTTPAFSFQWRGRRFAVRLQGEHLHFAVTVGRVPSTMGAGPRRSGALALLAALRQTVPQGWAMRLLPDHRIQLETDQDLVWPATVAALLTPIIALLLCAAPVIDVMDENGLG
jgi:hypothetical protein